MSEVVDKIFVAHATDTEGQEYEQAHASFDEAVSFLNMLAVQNDFEPEVVDSMAIVRFSVDKVFKAEVLRSLSFPDPE